MSAQWPTPPPAPRRWSATTAVPFEKRRGQVDRIEAMQARVTRVHGFIKASGGGGGFATADAAFPVWFLEMPVMVFGWSLEEGFEGPVDPADPPRFESGVVRWRIESRPMQVRYWSGATVGITGFGPLEQRGVVHWFAEGRALRAPTLGSGAVTAETVL